MFSDEGSQESQGIKWSNHLLSIIGQAGHKAPVYPVVENKGSRVANKTVEERPPLMD